MGTAIFFYSLAVVALGAGLTVFSCLDRIYRELGRVTTGRLHANLDIFEAEIEPKLGLERRRGALTFSLLAHFWLVAVAVETARGVIFFVPAAWEALVEMVVFLCVEVLLAMHFIPHLVVTRTTGRWLRPLMPAIRAFVLIVTPFRVLVELAISLAHISEDEDLPAAQTQQEGMEALVEAAQEEGILVGDQAALIEQVVEFSDKRVREVMTPRPDIVAITADATVEELHAKVVGTRFARLPVYEKSLDDIYGVAYAQDLLHIADQDLLKRKVRELAHPVMFIPETKAGSELLREMRQKNHPMAIVIDEHGLVAGLATVEDLVEEIVGESGRDDKQPAPDVVREPDGGLVMRGSMSIDDVEDLLGVHFGDKTDEAVTTIAGLLSHVSGKVPTPGDKVEIAGYRFEVLEANQRKILRLRIRKRPAASVSAK